MVSEFHSSSNQPAGNGSGRSLPNGLLIASAICSLFATLFSFYSINLHLRSYRKPALQRYVVRLLVMVPIYSLSSFASLFSLDAAFLIDLIRDLYEAFVIYCFFNLLVEYLGGERSLVILVHGRQPTRHPFPLNLFFTPLDISDPYTFLGLKRGILQYVQVKPILALLTVVLKSLNRYDDGKLAWNNGYTWVSATYNFSVFLSLYCLGMFWAGLSEDLNPFRVTSKFLCIKGIIFFSFWQGLGISILVAAGIIRQIGPVRDEQFLSLAVQDMLICLEMPLFALGHAYAFSPRDYIDPFAKYQSRLPAYYALRDAVGMYDVVSDSLNTIRGTGYGYQTFEPSEGVVHQGLGRERRSRAGLRYTAGGKAKYWLPQRGAPDASKDGPLGSRHQGPAKALRRWIDKRRMDREGFAPMLKSEAAHVIHEDPYLEQGEDEEQAEGSARQDHPLEDPNESTSLLGKTLPSSRRGPGELISMAGQWAHDQAEASMLYFNAVSPGVSDEEDDAASGLTFSDLEPDREQETMYNQSRNLTYGDYAFPAVDVAKEEERRMRWEEDEGIIRRHRQRKNQRNKVSRILGSGREGKGRSADKGQRRERSTQVDDEHEQDDKPEGVVDLLVEDAQAEERERLRERRRGDPAL